MKLCKELILSFPACEMPCFSFTCPWPRAAVQNINLHTLISASDLSVVRPSKEPGWLEGTLNGRTGLVPENYVEPIT